MKDSTYGPRGSAQDGNVLVGVLIALMMLAGLATPLLTRALRNKQATSSGVLASRLLAVAESGLGYNFSYLDKDPVYCVKDTTGFTFHAPTNEYRSADLLLSVGGAAQMNTFAFGVCYLDASGNPVVFANRATPTEAYKTIKVTSRAGTAQVKRELSAYYEFGFSEDLTGAIISDKVPASMNTGRSKSDAQDGNLVLKGDGVLQRHVVFGDIKLNAVAMYDGAGNPEITTANLATCLAGTRGIVVSRVGGTADEIPDYTTLASTDQLFDFDRYKAAAQAGAGAVHSNLAAFVAAMDAANGVGDKLEGIQVIEIDPAVEGGSPGLVVAGGIHITGTLMFLFAPGTSATYTLDIRCALNVNAADLTGVNFTNESTYTTGYPATYVDLNKKPESVDISGSGYTNFTATDDLPAIMSNNATLDIEKAINVCGLFYSAGFLDIDNKNNGQYTLYINGSLFGGNGIWIEAKKDAGDIAIRHDSNATDNLAVSGGKGLVLKRTGYMLVK